MIRSHWSSSREKLSFTPQTWIATPLPLAESPDGFNAWSSALVLSEFFPNFPRSRCTCHPNFFPSIPKQSSTRFFCPYGPKMRATNWINRKAQGKSSLWAFSDRGTCETTLTRSIYASAFSKKHSATSKNLLFSLLVLLSLPRSFSLFISLSRFLRLFSYSRHPCFQNYLIFWQCKSAWIMYARPFLTQVQRSLLYSFSVAQSTPRSLHIYILRNCREVISQKGYSVVCTSNFHCQAYVLWNFIGGGKGARSPLYFGSHVARLLRSQWKEKKEFFARPMLGKRSTLWIKPKPAAITRLFC